MAISSRAAVAMGLGLLGVAGLVTATYGQQQGDGSVRKAAGNPPATAAPTVFPKAVVATIDLEAVINGYDKAKFQAEQLKAEKVAKEGQLKVIYSEAQQLMKEMQALQAGSKDFKERESKLTEMKLKLQSGEETMKRDLQAKYFEIMTNSYKEIQDMTRRYAGMKGITCVLKNNSDPLKSSDPDSAMAMMAQPVMYSDASIDITRSILFNLNREYADAGGQLAKNPPGEANTDDAAKPASAERQAPARTPAPANTNTRAAQPRSSK